MPIRVVVADDNSVIRSAVARMLNADPALELVGEATNYAETIELVDALKPDVLLLDLHMPDEPLRPPEIIKTKVLENAGCILAISIWNDHDAKVLADNFGAKGLLDKAHLFSELIPSIKKLCLQGSK